MQEEKKKKRKKKIEVLFRRSFDTSFAISSTSSLVGRFDAAAQSRVESRDCQKSKNQRRRAATEAAKSIRTSTTTRIAPGVGAILPGQHSPERNQDVIACVGNLDAQVRRLLSFSLHLSLHIHTTPTSVRPSVRPWH
ncbi:hypothetical protein ACLOJK_002847 [Asimina triloba]